MLYKKHYVLYALCILFLNQSIDLIGHINTNYSNTPSTPAWNICANKQILQILDSLDVDSIDSITYIPHRSPQSFIQENIFDNLNDLNEYSYDFVHSLFSNHPYAQLDALARQGEELCSSEKRYLTLRKSNIKQILEQKCNKDMKDAQVPTIAFCFSGGGYRAMLATLGFLQGAEEIGLLGITSYIASLSGSTWAIALWHSLQQSPATICTQLKEVLHTDLFKGFTPTQAAGKTLMKKMFFGRKTSLIDFYGELLSNKLLPATHSDYYLYNHTALFENEALLPYPIYTSVLETPTKQYAWMEYTPHEIGSTYLDYFIPTWSFGRTFKAGRSTSRTQSEKLGFLLGIWGSAFSANIREIYDHLYPPATDSKMKNWCDKITSFDAIGNTRLSSAKVRNFTYQIPYSPLYDKRYLTLLDAGLDCNLPLHPLLRSERNIDIIIILDASASNTIAEELLKAQLSANNNNHLFPPVDPQIVIHEHCTIFTGTNTPTILYIPLIKCISYDSAFDPQESCKNGYCKTTNFVYKPEQIDQLAGLTKHIICKSYPMILNTIQEFIDTH